MQKTILFKPRLQPNKLYYKKIFLNRKKFNNKPQNNIFAEEMKKITQKNQSHISLNIFDKIMEGWEGGGRKEG